MSKVVVMFEVTPLEGSGDRYLELAAKLRPLLADCSGFIRAERFQSLSDAGKLLSINVWEDEQAAMEWRNQTEHRLAQMEGRERLFASYRITVAHVVREYTNTDRAEAPADSNQHLIAERQ